MEALENKFGVDEIVDTLTDAIKAEIAFRKSFPGGKFDVGKFILAAASQYPNIEEAIKDAGTFWQEVRDLIALENSVAYTRIIQGLTQEERDNSVILDIILVLVKTHVYVDDGIRTAANFYQSQVERGKELLELIKVIGKPGHGIQ